MTHPRTLRVAAAMVVPCLLAGCAGSNRVGTQPPEMQAGPPVLTPEVTGAARKRVGDAAEVIWSSDQPVRGELVGAPLVWSPEVVSDTRARVGGVHIVLSNHAAPSQGRCEEVDALLRVKVIFE